MSRVTLQQLLLAGSHFGHLTRRWHPNMKPFILVKKNGIHLLDLRKTQDQVEKAAAKLVEVATRGEQVLFVGTKPQARDIVVAEARRANSPYVTERWLGGMLTNFQTIRQGVKTLIALEKKMTDGTFEKISKKERLTIERRRAKLLDSLGGIRDMRHLPGAIFIVDIRRERIAVAEAHRLGIPVLAITDTNTDPSQVDIPVPANDDAFKSIALIMRAMTDAVIEGTAACKVKPHLEEPEVDTASREQEHRQARPGDSRGDDRRRRVRRPPSPHPAGRPADHGDEKPRTGPETSAEIQPRPEDGPAA